jgi:hypothetical protein
MRQKYLRSFLTVTIGLACATLLTACPHRGEGPAERVGKTMDKGVAAVGRGVEKTGSAIEGAASGK